MMSNQKSLTPELLRELLDADFEKGLLFWKPRSKLYFATQRSASVWNARFSGMQALTANHKDGYKHGLIFGRPVLAHRVLFAMKHGYWPAQIDHINGKRSDNKIDNLRSVSKQENSQNSKTPRTNTSGCIGVSWNTRDKRWTAYISLNKKRQALGNFVNFDDAVNCRRLAQSELGFHANHGR